MPKHILGLVSALAVAHAGYVLDLRASVQPQAKSVSQIAKEASPAVVTIVTHDREGKDIGLGSGFLVRADGVIVTNWHVMAGSSSATVTLKTGEIFNRVTFLDGDKDRDVAVLKVPGFGLPVLNAVADIPQVGSRIVTVGSPLGLESTVSEGIVSAIRLVEGRQIVQVTAPISHGSSGGPVFDSAGRVFAISTLTLEGGQQLNFAVPVKYAMGLLGGSTPPKNLADVFANDVASANRVGTSTAARPKPANQPLSSLAGTYIMTVDTGAKAALVVAGPVDGTSFGFAAFFDEKGKPSFLSLDTLRTNAAGEVAISIGTIAAGGYQTDEGFWVTGAFPADKDGVQKPFSYNAARYVPPISVDTGVYSVECRTSFTAPSGSDGGTTDWQGAAAVYALDGRLHVALVMENEKGGTTGLYADSSIDSSGRFDLRQGGNSLSGYLRAGALSGQWTDRRADGSVYTGPLTGQRK